ncbi:MAG: hypothetical protein WAX69_23485 [Victivallales bacterium]
MEKINTLRMFQEAMASHLELVKITAAVILASVFLPIGGKLSAADSVPAAKTTLELPVDPAKTPCVWLDAKPQEQKGQVPSNVPVAYAELTASNADGVSFEGNMIVLRKAGYASQTATFRFKLPDGIKAGTYDIWTHFALGGVAAQDFAISVGSSPDKLERRAGFRQSNGVSWQMDWRKGGAGAKLEIRPEDRWMEIVVAGMATQQRMFTGFLLAAETEESRLRDAVGAMQSPDASRRFYVLEGKNPEDIMTVLRCFSERKEAMKNKVDVQLLSGKEALAVAASAVISKLPTLVAAVRGVPLASLELPATQETVSGFIDAGRSPSVILECGKGNNSPSPEDVPILYGELTANDAEQAQASQREIILKKTGYASTTATLRYALNGQIKPGQYDVWTFFALGGLARQEFTVCAGADTDKLQTRTVFSQDNAASWERHWQKGASIRLYPQDRFIDITVKGMQTGTKILDDFVLVQEAPLPEGITPESGAWRSAVEGLKAASPKWRIWILEGEKAAESDIFYKQLTELPESVRNTCVSSVFLGAKAEELARNLGIERRPALMLMDDHYALRGVLTAQANAAQVDAFLKSTTGNGSAPGPFPVRPRIAAAASQPLENGAPRTWLTVCGWYGPAGFSLWGVDAEMRMRPNPADPCAVTHFDGGFKTNWAENTASDDGLLVLQQKSIDYTWARGVGYAHIYLDVEKDVDCALHLAHTGIGTQGWLDGQPLVFDKDPAPPADFARLQAFKPSAGETATGVTDQGGRINVQLGQSVAPQTAPLILKAGRHRLLIKLITQQPAGQTFAFIARFTDAEGKATAGVRTQLGDPDCAMELQAEVRRLTSRVTVDAPANLPHQGQPLKLRYDLRHEGDTTIPIVPFEARLVLEITDYDGKEVLRREVTRQFPGVAEFDLGNAPVRGYYAVQPTLYTPDGKLIMTCVPDGFSVIGGTASQFARREQKKMAVTYYFMGAGEGATYKTAFPWMTRAGIYRNIGSNPDFPIELAEAAKAAGIILTMDFWDQHNGYTQAYRDELAKRAAPYTRWYKSYNEIDIHPAIRKTPEHWVARSKGEYEAAKAARPDAFYVGGSLVYPGTGDWFTECLKLGLDQYVDAWDVHCYPQQAPTLEGSMSNSPNETELGVLNCYKRIGRTNTKPFWIGETGARASHGYDARRWQADTVAKMTACACSRNDFQYIGFLIPWWLPNTGTHAGLRAGICDISVTHMPAEAAYYTASALIDGFAYTRLDLGKDIQAARFGETLMLWTLGAPVDCDVTLGDGEWVIVDVVGRVGKLEVNGSGLAKIRLTTSPAYILNKQQYEKLTAL